MKKIYFAIALVAIAACNNSEEKGKAESALPFSLEGKSVKVYSTADSTDLRLSLTDQNLAFKPMGQPTENLICVFVDPGQTFQTYLGIGGALTDASAETFYKLPKDKQQELLRAYFDKETGIGYTLARTNLNSCDFSSGSYTYVADNDSSLSSFNIEPDRRYKIPFIKEAQTAAGGQLTLFASPWSPPAWMKTNNHMLRGGKLKPEYYSSWAHYYTKFIKEYEQEGIPIWGISIQNEPMATQTWESCIYTAEEERDFLKNHLGPVMAREGLADKKIILWDHNRDLIYQRAQTYFNDPDVNKYAWGIGFHWYEDWSGGDQMFDNVRRVYESFPDKPLLFTEGTPASFDSSRYKDWRLGEKYARSMIMDFNNGMVGFTDWNVLLDEIGGPNHVQNYCFAPIHGDTRSGELIYTNSYYYIGHFSRFIQPGAKRISATASRSQLLTTAFRNPDGSTVVVVMNQTGKEAPYFLWVNGSAVELKARPHSIATLIF